ncbi:uncharacterized protein LOC123552425 isoform X1 [Mercenaria mercenaria]|uniref:uncharacterized protein LOC123552425 isoform X1 n=1 Tax=Mercenaria mercenaria TaxID=6596 RepID=UPI001E1E0FBF|nr:uncharacterized protein LOC123552425 isoform X1 [Mercenaria mercenaria]XP_053397914.1 uncharacterized protein LOC123552425 isoform X1 [Mercenaria mercenaria]
MAEFIPSDDSHDMTETNDGNGQASSQFMEPPSDWAFNNLIAHILQNLDANDIDKIKLRFKGIIDEAVRSWEEAFDILMIKRYISADNLVYLQIILRVLDHQDLFAKTVEYAAKSRHRILHFYKTTTLLEGHDYVRIHVKSGRCVTEDHLYSIRNTISEALFIPMEDIMVAGIEEGNSVYLTLMLPEFFIEVLRQILENPRSRNILGPLGRLGIDKIILPPGSTFNVETDDETLHSGNIIHQLQLELQQKTYQMKELENEILKIKRNNIKVVPNGKKVKKRSYATPIKERALLKRVRPTLKRRKTFGNAHASSKLVPKRNNDDTLTQ